MIEVIYSSKGAIKRTDINKIPGELCLINAFDIGSNDLDILEKKIGISRHSLKHFFDNKEIPRLEKYKTYNIIILKYLIDKKIKTLGVVKSKNYVLTVCSENLKLSLEKDNFSGNSDSLLKSIVNQLIKNYSLRLEKLEDDINYQEDITFDNKIDNDPKQIFELKKELMYLKKALSSNKEVISKIDNFGEIMIELNQMVDTENTLSSRITGIMDMYMGFTSNKLNEIMKSFTIIASLLLLPTLIAGIYGMNIILPFAKHEQSFLIVIGIMLFMMTLMIIYFKHKKWV
jgi:magnesium transporter